MGDVEKKVVRSVRLFADRMRMSVQGQGQPPWFAKGLVMTQDTAALVGAQLS